MNSKVVTIHAMNAYGGVEVEFQSFLNSTLDGGEWLA
jgi:hypothetical protein